MIQSWSCIDLRSLLIHEYIMGVKSKLEFTNLLNDKQDYKGISGFKYLAPLCENWQITTKL